MFKRNYLLFIIIFSLMLSSIVPCTFAQSSYEDLVQRKNTYNDDSQERENEILLFTINNANTIIENTITEVPLIWQTDYPDVPFSTTGGGTVATSGCGVTCLTMLANYYHNEDFEPADLIPLFRKYIYSGTGGGAFDNSDDIIGLPLEKKLYNFNAIKKELENGKIAIVLMKEESIFTSGGHYIILTGINEDGLITVNDPNGYNYQSMPHKYETGFTDYEISHGLSGGWIYSAKDFTIYNQAVMDRSAAMSKLFSVKLSNLFDAKLISISPSGSILLN